jgi:uncharacterized membrane protein YeaQ/YmgE (transglycosylase-associated protein family)
MSPAGLIMFVIIGGLAGWISGVISKGKGYGLVGNIVIGILGAFLGGFCFMILGIVAYGFIGRLIFAVLGSLLLTWLLGLIRKKP